MGTHPLKRVFIIDKDPATRESINFLLSDIGYEIVGTASSGLDVIKKIENTNPAIVFLETELPDCNGLDLLNDLVVKFRKLKIIMISADASSDNVRKAIKRGAVGFIVKPLSKDNVLLNTQQAIQQLVAEHKIGK